MTALKRTIQTINLQKQLKGIASSGILNSERNASTHEGKIAYLALDVVEGEHAVRVSALSLDRGRTLARPGRTESGTNYADRPAEASRGSGRDAVPVPGIHELISKNTISRVSS